MRRTGQPHWRLFPASALERHASEWDAMVAACSYPMFLRSDVVITALREFGTGRELLAIMDGSTGAAAIGVFARSRSTSWETFQPSQIPLGAFLHDGTVPLERALASLLRDLPGIALMAAITQQDPAVIPRPVATPRLRTLDYIETARVEVTGSFDAYWTARGKNLRTNVKRQHARLASDGIAVCLEVVDTPDRVAAAIADYGRLESAGWKADGGTAVSADNAQGRFYTSVFESACARGTGRIFRYLFDGKVVAMDLCLEEAGVLVILKTTYDENWKSVSPASLMRHAYFQRIFADDRVRRVEYFGKVMEWHRRWTEDIRTLYHVNCYRTRWLGRLHDRIRGLPAKPVPANPA